MNKKVFIKTFGCQMNVYDSNRIYDSLKTIGFEIEVFGDDAVLVRAIPEILTNSNIQELIGAVSYTHLTLPTKA